MRIESWLCIFCLLCFAVRHHAKSSEIVSITVNNLRDFYQIMNIKLISLNDSIWLTIISLYSLWMTKSAIIVFVLQTMLDKSIVDAKSISIYRKIFKTISIQILIYCKFEFQLNAFCKTLLLQQIINLRKEKKTSFRNVKLMITCNSHVLWIIWLCASKN